MGNLHVLIKVQDFAKCIFKRGRLVVSIWGDSGGWGVDEWAGAVNGRLPQE